MSKNKRGSDVDAMYNEHLGRGAFRFNPADSRVRAIQRILQRNMVELAVNRFKWSNLPDSVDPRFLELTLYRRGLIVFYYDERYSRYLAVQGNSVGNNNMQDNPTRFQTYGSNYISPGALWAVGAKPECVPIWSNYLRTPDHDIVEVYSGKIADLDRTIEINSISARRTKVLAVNENTQLSVENINRELDKGVGAIRTSVDPATGMIPVTALDLGVDPDSIIKLSMLRGRLWNEAMGLLGIDNANTEKRERVQAAEVEANEDQVATARWVNLNARKQAAAKINERYGMDITVEYHHDVDTAVGGGQDEDAPVESDTGDSVEDENNGDVHA